MTAIRQDAWTEDDDLLLAEVTLRHIREGGTQLSAFEEVGQKLNRTAAACGFRWNSLVRKKYEAAIQIAKAQRQRRNYQKPLRKFTNDMLASSNHEDKLPHEESISFDSIIRYLKTQKENYKKFKNYEREIEEKVTEIKKLTEENQELKGKLKYIESDYRLVNEDYKALIQIMDRARKLAFLDGEDTAGKPMFKMDLNGNLERINK